MKVTVTEITDWRRVLNAARFTVHKKALEKEPGDTFRKKILLAEHSPIRERTFEIVIEDIPYCNMGHLVRHHEGLEKYVGTSREDRTGVPRDERRQTDPVDMMMTCNMQALINMSRKRLCACADDVTRLAMRMIVDELRKIDPILASVCVKECVYRGFCPEMTCCGYADTEAFRKDLEKYRKKDAAQGK